MVGIHKQRDGYWQAARDDVRNRLPTIITTNTNNIYPTHQTSDFPPDAILCVPNPTSSRRVPTPDTPTSPTTGLQVHHLSTSLRYPPRLFFNQLLFFTLSSSPIPHPKATNPNTVNATFP